MVEETVVEPEVTETNTGDTGENTEVTPKPETETTGKDDSLLGKESEGTEAEVVVPEKYEFNMPEGRELDAEMVDKFTPILQELKIPQEGAQKLADLLVQDQEAKEKAYQGISDGWKQDTIKALGTDYQAQLGVAAKFIDKFGNDNVRQVLNDTGLGNHPEVVQMFIKAGKHFGNDTFVTGTSNKPNVSSPESAARKMFPNTKYE